MKFYKCIWPLHIVSVKVNTIMALVKENKIFNCQTSRIISMNLIYHISEYRDDTFYNDYTKIMYYAVEKSMVRYNNLLRRMCKDKFDDVDISVLSTIADDLFRDKGGGPRVVVSTAAYHARVRGSVPGPGGLKETKMFPPHPRVKVSIVGSLRDREVACSASDRQGSNFESCVWRTVSSQSSHHPQEVLLAQFSLYVHKGGLKPDSFHFISFSFRDKTCNWGRIISPFTFCGTLAKQSASKDMYKIIDESTPSTLHHIHNTTNNTQHTTYINLHTSHYTHHTQHMFHHTHQSTHITLHTSHTIHHTCSTTHTHTSHYIQHITHIELHTTHHTA